MHWTCILSWVVWSFNINYSSPWTWYIFSSVCVIFNFFHQYIIVLGYMSFTSLGRFIPRHFIIFPVIKNRIFLIFLSDGILLVYRKIIGFYISTLYPEPFLNSLKRSSSFLLTSLGFYTFSIMSPSNSDSFTSFFPIWSTPLFFCFLFNYCG